jgi:3-oxoacyl-[acyl-carrier protein] reductase
MKKIEDFFVGQKAQFSQLITEEVVKKFVDLTGDDNPLHTNKEFAEKSSFKGIVTHGMLSASFISTMVGKHIPGDGALWVSQNLQFLLPVRLGDELLIKAEITKLSLKERLMTLKTEILNQFSQKVLTGEGQVKLLEIEKIETKFEEHNKEKVALVTGSSRGIGAAISKKLATKGYKIIVNFRSDELGAENTVNEIISQGGEATSFKADVSKQEEVDKLFSFILKQYGTISVLINNASPKIIEKKMSESVWDDYTMQLEGQLKSAVLCSNAAIKQMEKNKKGSIINIGSVVSLGVPPLKWGSYTVAKAALTTFTKCLAAETGPMGIRVNMVSPGMTETQLVANIPEKQRLLQAAQTPLRRLSTTDDIAEAVSFFASDESSFISGENLLISGGKVMH